MDTSISTGIIDDPEYRLELASNRMPPNYWVKIRKVGAKNKCWFIVPRAKALRMLLGLPSGFNQFTNPKLKHKYEVA